MDFNVSEYLFFLVCAYSVPLSAKDGFHFLFFAKTIQFTVPNYLLCDVSLQLKN